MEKIGKKKIKTHTLKRPDESSVFFLPEIFLNAIKKV